MKKRLLVLSFKTYLRRGVACLMAVGGLGLILLGASANQSQGGQPWTDSTLPLSLLQMELGGLSNQGTTMTALTKLISGESVYLRSVLGLDTTTSDVDEEEDDVTVAPSPTEELPAGQPAPDHDDITEEPITTAAPEDIVARTLIPTSTQGYDYYDDLYVYNRTELTLDLEEISNATVDITLGDSDSPQVLIIHTHGTEAFTPDGTDIYVPSDSNTRTTDENYNVIRVGDEVEQIFTEMGLNVIHDTTLYDYPQYINSYSRSGYAVAEYLAAYPSIQIVLDIHRDALIGEDDTVYKAVTEIDGNATAQVMLVLGSSTGDDHPDWEENLTLATKLQQSMNTLYPTLARPITLRTSTYNQQLSTGSVLVEIGCHGNTLQEALWGARYFARAAGQVLLGLQG